MQNHDTLDHLEFKRKTVRFYEEDEDILKKLPLKDRTEYKAMLKKNGRYTYFDDNDLKGK